MKIACWTIIRSPHQLPLAKAIVKRIGDANYRYLYVRDMLASRKVFGWAETEEPLWCMQGREDSPELMDADLVYTCGLRPLELMKRRIAAGKKTYYMTERWFKPIRTFGLDLPGTLRLLFPSYIRMARRMVKMLNNPLCKCLAIGPWAKKDMLLIGVRPEQIWDWGYFVEQQLVVSGRSGDDAVKLTTPPLLHYSTLKVLWVGRLLKLKRVDTIIRAIGELSHSTNPRLTATLDIYGTGSEEGRLKKQAAKYGDVIKFHAPVSIAEVRKLMREHDVYVLASNAHEGWGAVVSEALEEDMRVIGTYEAGASAAILPKERLFHSGDVKALSDLLNKEAKGELPPCSIGGWTAEMAAERLIADGQR